jgi:autotransporter-associated beta strand protein
LILTGTGAGVINAGNLNLDSLTKAGSGSWTLKGDTVNGTYTGVSAVRNGQLILTASALNSTNGPLGNSSAAVLLGDTTSFTSPVAAATTDAVSLSGPQTVDGVSLSNGQRVLVMNQTDANQAQNGVWVVNTGGAWSRASDTLTYGLQVSVSGGTINAGKQFYVTTRGAIAAGTTKNAWAPDDANPSASLLTGGAFTVARDINVVNNGSSGTSTLGGNTAAASVFSGNVTLNAHSLNVTATSGGSVNFNGNILNGSGTPGVTKVGAGTVTLSGVNTYTGVTNVSAGTLALATAATIDNSSGINVSGSSAVFDITGKAAYTVGSVVSQTLSGSGTVNLGAGKTLTIASGSIVSPGGSPGTLDITGNLTLSSASSTLIELGGGTPGDGPTFYDQLNTTGSITLGSGATLSVSAFGGFPPGAVNDAFFILTRGDAGSFTTTFSGLPEGSMLFFTNGGSAKITYVANWTGSQLTSTLTGGNDVALYDVVPEPGSLAAFLGMGILMTSRLRRRI